MLKKKKKKREIDRQRADCLTKHRMRQSERTFKVGNFPLDKQYF